MEHFWKKVNKTKVSEYLNDYILEFGLMESTGVPREHTETRPKKSEKSPCLGKTQFPIWTYLWNLEDLREIIDLIFGSNENTDKIQHPIIPPGCSQMLAPTENKEVYTATEIAWWGSRHRER